MKIVTIVGARPQFVKAAVLSDALRKIQNVEEVLIHTGQHYDDEMSGKFFEELSIPRPEINLGIGSGTHAEQTGHILIALDQQLRNTEIDAVVVYGDTNSTLAGSLAAAKRHIPVVHVEAGLRSFNKRMPEEINRILTDHCSDLLFAPTDLAVDNLMHEGICEGDIYNCGDVMFDAAILYAARAELQSGILSRLGLSRGSYALSTVHRAENTDDKDRLSVICQSLERVSRGLEVIFPVHPRTRKALQQFDLEGSLGGVRLVDPVGYLDMVLLEKNARLILTDSGGVQKEAFFYRVPCITMRDETEWVELIDLGWNRLGPPVAVDTVLKAVEEALASLPTTLSQPYGNGDAGSKIAGIIDRRFSRGN